MAKHSLTGRSLISIDDLTKTEIEVILSMAKAFKRQPNRDHLESKIIASCFFEPSTRTRLSFEAAVLRLSGKLIGFTDSANTSTTKGESLEDTVRMMSAYADAIILRHPEENSAKRAALVSSVPVINAGDGSAEHPTQTLLDLFALMETQGKIDGLHIAMAGDLKHGRTVHSLAKALCHYKVRLTFIAPEDLEMPEAIIQQCKAAGLKVKRLNTLQSALSDVDVLYMTRLQRERTNRALSEASPFVLQQDHVATVPQNFKILHPLPRVDEIDAAIDNTPYAHYFKQAEDGVYVRQALLSLILNEMSF